MFVGRVHVGVQAGGTTTHFLFFPLPSFQTARKILREASPAEWRGERIVEATAAIPFPLKPLFLAAAADAVNFYEFLIKYVRALL